MTDELCEKKFREQVEHPRKPLPFVKTDEICPECKNYIEVWRRKLFAWTARCECTSGLECKTKYGAIKLLKKGVAIVYGFYRY
jgi:hypothetical protein